MIAASLSAVARRYAFVREVGGSNDGSWVNFFQRFTGNRVGDSWCASFVSVVLDVAYRGRSPLKRSASCGDLLNACHALGYVVKPGDPVLVDDLFFYTKPGSTETPYGDAHHIGIVTSTTPASGIAGNTSEDGKSSNGTGVFEHPLATTASVIFARLPKEII